MVIIVLICICIIAAIVYFSYRKDVDEIKKKNPGVKDADIRAQEKAFIDSVLKKGKK